MGFHLHRTQHPKLKCLQENLEATGAKKQSNPSAAKSNQNQTNGPDRGRGMEDLCREELRCFWCASVLHRALGSGRVRGRRRRLQAGQQRANTPHSPGPVLITSRRVPPRFVDLNIPVQEGPHKKADVAPWCAVYWPRGHRARDAPMIINFCPLKSSEVQKDGRVIRIIAFFLFICSRPLFFC